MIDKVSNSRARRRIVLLDSCRESLASDNRRAPRRIEPAIKLEKTMQEGQAIVFAARSGRPAWPTEGNGVMTAGILDGLSCKALDQHDRVTVGSVAQYANEMVIDWVRRHRPYDTMKDPGIDMVFGGSIADFPLANCRQAVRDELSSKKIAERPKILSPQDGVTIPSKEDEPECVKDNSCWHVPVKGRVPPGQWPYIAVAPLQAAPNIWIQPLIVGVKENGEFNGMAYLGTTGGGARQYYSIYILAHPRRDRFLYDERLEGLPDDCLVSDPVTVFRAR